MEKKMHYCKASDSETAMATIICSSKLSSIMSVSSIVTESSYCVLHINILLWQVDDSTPT
ncbi:hypothetical protein Hanom_Chr10g00933581 [Helianthus anomalus]